MDYNATTKADMKNYGLSVKELAMIDLIALGWDMKDAYFAMFNEGMTWDKGYLYKKISSITDSNGAMKRMEYRKKGIKLERQLSDENIEDIDLDEVSKENTLKELIKAKKQFKAGTKEWLDIQKQIIEVTQMKKDEVKEEETTVHYYLPLWCEECALYLKSKRKGED